jgi:ADP-ribose pyrophosphatase
MVPMGWIWTTPGFTDEKIWLYLGTDLAPVEPSLEDDEVLTVERMPLERAVEMAQRGELIRDAKSICALLRAPHFR